MNDGTYRYCLFLLFLIAAVFALPGCVINRQQVHGVSPVAAPAPAVAKNVLIVHFLNYSPEKPKYLSKPYVIIYIDGKPFKLTLDTGATGVMVNQSALQAKGLSLPNTGFLFSGRFKRSCSPAKRNTGFSGYITYARISTAFKGGLSTPANFPIAVDKSNCFYPGGLEGTFGMGLSPYSSIGKRHNSAFNRERVFTPSPVAAFPEGFNNGFILKLAPGFNKRRYTGEIIFGLNKKPDNAVYGNFHFFPDIGYKSGYISEYPMIKSRFGMASSSRATNKNFLSIFDTGFPLTSLSVNALKDGIINFNRFMTYRCLIGGKPVISHSSRVVRGGLKIFASFMDNYGNYIYYNITSCPQRNNNAMSGSLCRILASASPSNPFLNKNYILDAGKTGGVEIFGLQSLYKWIIYWRVKPWGIGLKEGNGN